MHGLYDPNDSRDNCGFGLIAHLRGEASHQLVRTAIEALASMTHRGGIAADGRTGDGCGLLLQKPDLFLRRAAQACGAGELTPLYGVGMLMLSRNEEEIQLFTELDRLRYEQEKLIYPNFDSEKNYRLMGINDVPEWLKRVEETKDLPEEPLGKRKPRITDFSMLRDIESDEEDKAYARLKSKKKKEKTAATAHTEAEPERPETPAEPNDIYNESDE